MNTITVYAHTRPVMSPSSCCHGRAAITSIFATVLGVVFLLCPVHVRGDSHLLEGIRLYNGGRFDEALNELRAEIEQNPSAPAAYYYAAKIRTEKGQYSRALQNIDAALRDSSDYSDATALRAFTLLKTGRERDAVDTWKLFLRQAGVLDGDTLVTADAIISPDAYHEKLERERIEAEKRKHELEALENKRITGRADSIAAAAQPATGQPGILGTENLPGPGMEAPLVELENRVRSQIRRGIYGFVGIIAVAGLIAGIVYLVVRKRKKRREELTFSDEVGRLLINNETELDRDSAVSEFEAKKREILEVIRPQREPGEPVVPADASPYEATIMENAPALAEPVPAHGPFIPAKGVSSPITEEVKTLVSRLFREGQSAEEIARTADLTVTEVKLILAVREHYTNALIEEFVREDEGTPDREGLIHAVHDLSAEGLSTRQIAKTLNISTSEVELASKVISLRKNTSRR